MSERFDPHPFFTFLTDIQRAWSSDEKQAAMRARIIIDAIFARAIDDGTMNKFVMDLRFGLYDIALSPRAGPVQASTWQPEADELLS